MSQKRVSRRLADKRFNQRLAWAGLVVVLLGVVVMVVIAYRYPTTSPSERKPDFIIVPDPVVRR